jgi:hypothetical protein
VTVEMVANRRPVAGDDDSFGTSPGHALSGGLLGNDNDPDGDALWIGAGYLRP